MDIAKKLNKKTFIISAVFAGFLAVFCVFIFQGAKARSNTSSVSIQPQKLAIIQENSLLGISDPSLPEPKTVKKVRMVVTAYSSTTWQTDSDPLITASGKTVKEGTVANNLLPFGTKIRIPELYGDKIFVVEDRMNRRKGYYHLDIWFPNYWQAKGFGAKRAYIEVLES